MPAASLVRVKDVVSCVKDLVSVFVVESECRVLVDEVEPLFELVSDSLSAFLPEIVVVTAALLPVADCQEE